MPDDPGATPDGGATPPAGTPPTPPGSTQPATGDEPLAEGGKAALAAERLARQEAERELKKLRDRDLSETEKRDARIKELEAENSRLVTERQQARVESAAIAAARKAGFWEPDLAYRLLNPDDVTFDEAGRPKNVEALVAAIAKERPRLVNGQSGAPDFGGGPRGEPAAGGATDMNARIREAAGR